MPLSYLKEHYGDIASVVGLVVTFFGFVATIGNVRKAKRAAEEARKAAREAVSRIKSQVLVTEIASCLQLVRHIDSSCRERNWSEAMKRGDEARTSLSKVRDHQVLDGAEKTSVVSAIEQIGKLLPYVQKIRNDDPERDVSSTKMMELHRIIVALGQIQGRLESQNFEV